MNAFRATLVVLLVASSAAHAVAPVAVAAPDVRAKPWATETNARVASIGGRLLAANGPYPCVCSFRFEVVEGAAAFAYSLGDGSIVLSRAMVAAAESDHELAAVVAHEIAHVALRHSKRRDDFLLQQARWPSADGAALFKALLWQIERKADALGVRILANAEYDPMALARSLRTLATPMHPTEARELIARADLAEAIASAIRSMGGAF